MSKNKKKSDTGQGSLFDLLKKVQAERMAEPGGGSLNVQHRLRGALVRAIKQSPLSRWEIAGKMGELLGVEVSKHMLDAWTSEAKDYHRFPAEYLPAFCEATGCREPFLALARAAGLFVVEGPDALRSEIQALDEQMKKLGSEKRKRLTLLQELEEEATPA